MVVAVWRGCSRFVNVDWFCRLFDHGCRTGSDGNDSDRGTQVGGAELLEPPFRAVAHRVDGSLVCRGCSHDQHHLSGSCHDLCGQHSHWHERFNSLAEGTNAQCIGKTSRITDRFEPRVFVIHTMAFEDSVGLDNDDRKFRQRFGDRPP